jgi:putative flavoprotein involved in K+ transport
VLIVGAANSGAEIAIDLVRDGRPVSLSGRTPGQVPFDIRKPFVHRVILRILFRLVFHRVLSLSTPLGRRARPRFTMRGLPLIRTRERDLAAAGVKRVGRTAGVTGGKPRLDDGTVLDVSGVVWATGFDIGPSWVRLPVFDAHLEPIQERGVARGEPGLYFVGTHFLHSVSSGMIHGIARDAEHVARVIGQRMRSRPVTAA